MTRHGAPERYVHALRFAWLTPAYDLVVAATTRERRVKTALIDQALVGPAHHVLDLACGTGTLAVWTKQRHPTAELRGLDGDTSVLARAARKARRLGVEVQFDHGLSTRLPYADASFDRVLCSLFFHHLNWSDKQATAREILRVLRPGGELHVADWGPPSGVLARVGFFFVRCLDGFDNTRDNAQGRLPLLFRQAGFDGVAELQTFDTVFGTLVLYRALRPQRSLDRPQAQQRRDAYAEGAFIRGEPIP
ncbi:MAG: class I SAM-dependent methyltransferase [Pseudomonadota bacterium]